MKVFCAVILLASSLVAVATSYPMSSEGRMETILQALIREEIDARLQQGAAEEKAPIAVAKEEVMEAAKAEEENTEVILQEEKAKAKAQDIRKWLHEIYHKLKEIIERLRPHKSEGSGEELVLIEKTEGDEITETLSGIHDKIIKEIEDIIRQLDALDPEGIIRNFLEGVLGELNNSESHESQTM